MKRLFGIVLATIVLTILSVNIVSAVFFQQPYSFVTSSNIPFYIQYARVDGAFYSVPNVITITASRTLQASESGSVVNVQLATGHTITLPTPTVGLTYDVILGTSQSTGANQTQKVITNSASVFIAGGVVVETLSGTGTTAFPCNGSSHIAIATNGSTTGGIMGSRLKFTALSSTLWGVQGTELATGNAATPCSAS